MRNDRSASGGPKEASEAEGKQQTSMCSAHLFHLGVVHAHRGRLPCFPLGREIGAILIGLRCLWRRSLVFTGDTCSRSSRCDGRCGGAFLCLKLGEGRKKQHEHAVRVMNGDGMLCRMLNSPCRPHPEVPGRAMDAGALQSGQTVSSPTARCSAGWLPSASTHIWPFWKEGDRCG